jgi:hypothetical protein
MDFKGHPLFWLVVTYGGIQSRVTPFPLFPLVDWPGCYTNRRGSGKPDDAGARGPP